MQSINKAIQNPLFFASFMGTLFLLPLSAWLNYKPGLCFIFLCGAAIIYGAGVFGITIFGNVPLNEALAKIDLPSSTANEITEQRLLFEKAWLTLHNIRTIASVVCLILVILSCLYKNQDASLAL